MVYSSGDLSDSCYLFYICPIWLLNRPIPQSQRSRDNTVYHHVWRFERQMLSLCYLFLLASNLSRPTVSHSSIPRQHGVRRFERQLSYLSVISPFWLLNHPVQPSHTLRSRDNMVYSSGDLSDSCYLFVICPFWLLTRPTVTLSTIP